MFWQFNHNSSPQIETVLVKEDATLNEILDQENVLLDLKSQNKKLIEFITRGDILSELVGLVTEEPSLELDEQERYRRSNLACEVLTTDIPILNERLSDRALITRLYSFLEGDPPLNPLMASFFSRTLSMLICRKTDQYWYSYQFTCLQVLEFLKTKENSLDLLLKHLGTSAIMDLTLKLMTHIEGNEMQQNVNNWLESEGFIDKVVDLFKAEVDEDRHYNAAQLLSDTVKKCREMVYLTNERTDPDPILDSVQSPETIQKLLDNFLGGELVESSIVGGVTVLLTLLEPPTNNSDLNNRRGAYNNMEESGDGEPPPPPNPALFSIVSAIIPYLPALHNLLLNPPKKCAVKLACGTIEPPLGNTRLTVIKLIAALISTNTPQVNETLDSLNTVHVLLDLFFHYTWNNFLHSQVDKCLAFALNSTGPEPTCKNPLIPNIFIKCRLLQRILEAWQDNETEQNKTGGKRRGYMGHLTNIANSVIKQNECLGDFINENVDEETLLSWQHYVETSLQPINELHQRFLGGKHPSQISNKDEDLEYKDATFADETSGLQNYADFPSNTNLANNYIESYVYDPDPDFNHDSNALEDLENDENETKRANLFKEMCSQKKAFIGDIGNDDDNDEIWADTLPTSVWNRSKNHSSSDEDDEVEDKIQLKVDKEEEAVEDPKFADLWSTPVLEQPNPWLDAGEASSGLTLEEGWADFANFNPQFESPVRMEFANFNESSSEKRVDPPKPEFGGSFPVEESEEPGVNEDNANCNSQPAETTIEKELIDNFRFLSVQGMISEESSVHGMIPEECSKEVSDKSKKVSVQDIVSEESSKEVCDKSKKISVQGMVSEESSKEVSDKSKKVSVQGMVSEESSKEVSDKSKKVSVQGTVSEESFKEVSDKSKKAEEKPREEDDKVDVDVLIEPKEAKVESRTEKDDVPVPTPDPV